MEIQSMRIAFKYFLDIAAENDEDVENEVSL